MESKFISQMEQIRRLVAESLAPREFPGEESSLFGSTDESAGGWFISEVDPSQALQYFSRLRLKNGWRLVGLEYRSGENGNGVVYTIPADSSFELPRLPTIQRKIFSDMVLEVPRPLNAAPSVIDAIESDGDFEAYVQVSILFREFQEFGARWHGCLWSTHTILSNDPWEVSSTTSDELGERRNWIFRGRIPGNWSPMVLRSPSSVMVKFYTFSGLGRSTIYCHHDRYRPPRLLPISREGVIATGSGGFVF